MKIIVIGLDGVTSELLFSDERLENIRRLMEYGCYGNLSLGDASDRLEMWMSLVAGQDLGPLGEVGTEDLEANQGITIWKQMEEQNKGVIVVGLPPFISHPEEIKTLVDKTFLEMRLQQENSTIQIAEVHQNRVYSVSRKQIDLIRSLVQSEKWDYFQFIDDGLYQLQRSRISKSDNYGQDLLTDYCLHLDEQIGTIFELLDDSTIVLVVSLYAGKPDDGGFILASSNNPIEGEIEGAQFLDIAPTVLELGGYEVPTHMQGESLVAGKMLEAGTDVDLSSEEEEILRERLSGLGYLS